MDFADGVSRISSKYSLSLLDNLPHVFHVRICHVGRLKEAKFGLMKTSTFRHCLLEATRHT